MGCHYLLLLEHDVPDPIGNRCYFQRRTPNLIMISNVRMLNKYKEPSSHRVIQSLSEPLVFYLSTLSILREGAEQGNLLHKAGQTY